MLIRNFLALEKAPFLFSLCLHSAFFGISYYGIEKSLEKHWLSPPTQLKINAISILSGEEVKAQRKKTPNKELKKSPPPRADRRSIAPLQKDLTSRPLVTNSNSQELASINTSQQRTEKRHRPRPVSAEYILGSPQNPLPEYPLEALQNGYEGVVRIRVRIDEKGAVVAAKIDKSSAYGCLDAAALETLKTWTFKPGHLGNRSIQSELTVPIKFVLDDPN